METKDIKTRSITGNFSEKLRDKAVEVAQDMKENETVRIFEAGKGSIVVSRDDAKINSTLLIITIGNEEFFVGV